MAEHNVVQGIAQDHPRQVRPGMAKQPPGHSALFYLPPMPIRPISIAHSSSEIAHSSCPDDNADTASS